MITSLCSCIAFTLIMEFVTIKCKKKHKLNNPLTILQQTRSVFNENAISNTGYIQQHKLYTKVLQPIKHIHNNVKGLNALSIFLCKRAYIIVFYVLL